MRAHNLDLNAILERVKKESYQDGYNAALQDVGRFINANLGKPLEQISITRPRTARHGRFVEGSLAALVLSKIEAHPNGLFALEIKDWLRSGDSAYAHHPQAYKRVDTALTRLKSHYGAIVKKDDGKWYPVSEFSSSREEAA
jgi:hypothetical protein